MITYELETFEGLQPSILRQRFVQCKIGNLFHREIYLENTKSQSIKRLDERPALSPHFGVIEIRKVSSALHVLATLIRGNDAFIDRVGQLIRDSMVNIPADKYDEIPEEQKQRQFYKTPFSLHKIGIDGEVIFKTPSILRMVQPEAIDPHLEEIERRSSFTTIIYKSNEDGCGFPNTIIPTAQEFRQGNEHHTTMHHIFRQPRNELGI